MLQSDAMQDPDSMLVYANMVEEIFPAQSYEIRGISWFLRQALELLQVKIIPTGSRLYGLYHTNMSDWDFLAPYVDRIPLLDCGWSPHVNPKLNSVYMGKLNLIIPASNDEYDRMVQATNKCIAVGPRTKKDTVAIWQSYGIIPPISSNNYRPIGLSEI